MNEVSLREAPLLLTRKRKKNGRPMAAVFVPTNP
jgi:uncharacterized membrane protein